MEAGLEAQSIRVLIVDDHPVVRDGYRRLLESTDDIRVVAEAETGEDGYEAYKTHAPDVAIMDLSMPGAGGLEAIRRIAQWDAAARILVFSVHENPAYQQKAAQAGATGYVSKRSAPTEMITSVREVARGERYFTLEPASDDSGALADEQRSIETLTLREFEVFHLLALGNPVPEVARILNISQNTAGVHQTRIMNKLGLHNAAQLARLAIRHGIVKA